MADLEVRWHPVLCTLRAFRNGAYYGTKIRAPHGIVLYNLSL